MDEAVPFACMRSAVVSFHFLKIQDSSHGPLWNPTLQTLHSGSPNVLATLAAQPWPSPQASEHSSSESLKGSTV